MAIKVQLEVVVGHGGHPSVVFDDTIGVEEVGRGKWHRSWCGLTAAEIHAVIAVKQERKDESQKEEHNNDRQEFDAVLCLRFHNRFDPMPLFSSFIVPLC